MPSTKGFATMRIVLVLALLAGCVALISATREHNWTVHDKAYYADPNLVNFVRPGLNIKILSAEIATDGTIKARLRVTDPKGLPLDRDGVITPGAISMSLIAATIDTGQKEYRAYTTRSQTSPITKQTAIQAGADSGGVWEKVADGEYVYTFKTKAPANYNRNATHTIGVYGSRNLTEFDMGTQYDDDVFTFVPNGSKVTTVRDVIRTSSCNRCHDQLAFHGGTRRSMELCVLCHTQQTVDPDTGNTVDMPVMTHKIHAGKDLPSVQAGGKYQIIGHNQSVADYSTVGFPANIRRCETCHEQNTGAAQATAYLTPNRAACGACHDDVNFATGQGHVNLPQTSDNMCSTCHQVQGEFEFDASVKGAHTVETQSPSRPGAVVEILKVENGSAGKSPTVTFTLKDFSGKGINPATLTVRPNRLALVLAGPTIDYGYTDFGAGPIGYASEEAGAAAKCSNDGLCTYTFTAKIPANAKGTYTVGIEARREQVINPGTKREVATEYGAINKVYNFSVDGSKVAPRRTVVTTEKCNSCHVFLSMHGENRNQVEQCILCHNASETDKARRVVATNPADKALPPQSVDFALMIHKIHTGEKMHEQNRGYTVVGYGGSHNDFSEVRYPAFSPSGSPGDTRNCNMCHVDGSQNLPLQWGLNQVTDPQGLLNPVGKVTAACTACHGTPSAASHALTNTSKELGESCEVCHGANAEFNVNRVHAR
ncbi:MAG: OmcA/MtrC family decaheme c-type cytochrome [Bryobacteraceae bacterium]